MKTKMTEKVWDANQSWYYQAVHKLYGRTLRVDIRRNAYDEQSWAKISLFDKETGNWNVIATNPHMKCLHISYVQKNIKANVFLSDEDILLKEAKMLLE